MSLKWIDYAQGQNCLSWIYLRQIDFVDHVWKCTSLQFILQLTREFNFADLSVEALSQTADFFLYKMNTVRSYHTYQVMLGQFKSYANVMHLPVTKQWKAQTHLLYIKKKNFSQKQKID